jgi:hypothetical protein
MAVWRGWCTAQQAASDRVLTQPLNPCRVGDRVPDGGGLCRFSCRASRQRKEEKQGDELCVLLKSSSTSRHNAWPELPLFPHNST